MVWALALAVLALTFQLPAQRPEAPDHEPATHAQADAGVTDAATSIAQQDPAALALLENVRNHYRRIRGFSATFSMRLRTRAQSQDLTSNGTLRFAFPASLRLEFARGGAIYTSDGVTARLYAPSSAHHGWFAPGTNALATPPEATQDTWLELPSENTPLALLNEWMTRPPRPEHLVRVIEGAPAGQSAIELRSAITPLLDRIVLGVENVAAQEARIVRVMLFDFSGNYVRLALSNVRAGIQPPPSFRLESVPERRGQRPLHVIRP